MRSTDLRDVVVAYLSAPLVVEAEQTLPGGWVSRRASGGCDALPESIHFLKERRQPGRYVCTVHFATRQGQQRRMTCSLEHDPAGEWHVVGGAGGSIDGSPVRSQPWVNLGGGGWPRQFYAGGAVVEQGATVTRVRVRAANGTEVEDTVDDGEVLFLSDQEVQVPIQVELYDRAGNVVSRHTAFA